MDKSSFKVKCLPAINFVQKIGVYESKNVTIVLFVHIIMLIYFLLMKCICRGISLLVPIMLVPGIVFLKSIEQKVMN